MNATESSRPVVATQGLIDGLLDIAARKEPEKVTVDLAVTPGREFDSIDVAGDVPVFSHYYLPDIATAVSNVFGMNFTVPPGQTDGRFVSHPTERLELTTKDSLHEVVFLAVPPWTPENVRAFDRSGRRYQLRTVNADLPRENPP